MNMKKINSILVIAMSCFLFGCHSYDYSCTTTNYNEYKILVNNESSWRNPGNKPYACSLSSYNSEGTFSFSNRPWPKINVRWGKVHPQSHEVEKWQDSEIEIKLPEEFTRYDGADLNLCFEDDRVWLAYGYYYGKPRPDAEDSYIKRISRERKYVLEDGTPFNPDEYKRYKRDNPKSNLDEFLKKKGLFRGDSAGKP